MGVDQETCREVDVVICSLTPRGMDGTVGNSKDIRIICTCSSLSLTVSVCLIYITGMDFGMASVRQHILTSLLRHDDHFLSKHSCSILVCCSHRHIVGRVGHQIKNVIGQHHSSRFSDCFKEDSTHIIKRVYSLVLHLISGETVVMS